MGNSSSGSIAIDLDDHRSVYYTDEIISENVRLNIEEGVLKGDEISICLTGEIGYI